MRYHALACDYDGTIAHDGQLSESTIRALEQVRESGRKVILVTGRELDDLILVCPRLDLFDRVVAENGALLYRPATREEKVLGDAENDHAFLHMCECSVAVANALETLKQHVDWVASKRHGEGTSELCRALIDSDLRHIEGRHHRLCFGKAEDGSEVTIQPYGTNVLIAGSPGGGKSTLATAVIERLEERRDQ